MPYDSIYIRYLFRVIEILETDSGMLVDRDWEEITRENCFLMNTEFQFYKMKSSGDGW
jgi:hypothetical protein